MKLFINLPSGISQIITHINRRRKFFLVSLLFRHISMTNHLTVYITKTPWKSFVVTTVSYKMKCNYPFSNYA